jgi:hypothetical protein
MDKWLDVAQKATTVALKTTYSYIEEIFAEDLPCVYLETRAYLDVIKKGLKNYSHKAVGNVYNNWNAPWWYWRTEWAIWNWPPHCRQREFVCFAGTRYHIPWAAVSQPRVPRRERSATWGFGPEL